MWVITRFSNNMSVVKSKDDVFTVLIHLGYLSYDWKKVSATSRIRRWRVRW